MDRSQTKILVIEDDELLRENVSYFLKTNHFVVEVAENGKVGVEKATLFCPDLILCDVMMPELNGFEVFQAVQKIDFLKVVPFVFLTAKVDLVDIRKGLTLGADDYILKPFSFENLLESIQTRLAKFEAIRQSGNSQYASLLNSAVFGIVILKNTEITFLNQKFEEIVGQKFETENQVDIGDVISNADEVITMLKQSDTEGLTKVDLSLKSDGSVVSCFGNAVLGEDNFVMMNLVKSDDYFEGDKGEGSVGSSDTSRQEREIIDSLTRREKEVLMEISKGLTNTEVADKLHLSVRTVDWHRTNLISKTYTRNRVELINFALRNGLARL